MNDEEFDEALSLLVDDEISPDLFAALEAHLAGSEAAQRDYLDHIKTHAVLALKLAPHALQNRPTKIIPMERILERQKRRAIRWAFGVGAAAILIATLISVFVMLPDPPLGRFKSSAFAELEIIHGAPDGTEPEEGDELAIGSRMKLSRGTVEIKLRTGVIAVVRAPAELTLQREELVRLSHGTAAFQVPAKAVGFQVDTPEFLLTDLGTEFGVISTPAEPDEVHVFVGKVKVQNHLGVGEEIALGAGDARVAETDGQWLLTEIDPGEFLYSIPSEPELPPYLHWSFDDAGSGQLAVGGTHSDRHRISTRAVDGMPGVAAGKVGQAIDFGGSGARLRSNWSGISGSRPQTVAFWLKLPQPDSEKVAARNAFTLVHWGLFTHSGNHEWAVRVTNQRYTPGAIGSIGDTTRLHLFMGSGWFNGSTELADGEWHHVAVRYNGQADERGLPIVDFFIDGRYERAEYGSEAPPTRLDIDTESPAARPLGIAVSRWGSPPFEGEIDELYIFDGEIADGVIEGLAGPQ